jgi:DNA polymerase-3 subunit alpha
MAAEREAFGFYFAEHPVEQYRMIALSNGARSYSSCMEGGSGSGGRQPAVMAALVESVSKGRTRRGGEFIRADFSDSSGQFSAACFEEGLVEQFQRWAADGTCVLLNVELDAPSPDEPPRITVRGAKPLTEVTSAAKMQLRVEVRDTSVIVALRDLLKPGPRGQGEVLLRLQLGEREEPLLLLGRDFALDGSLVERLQLLDGVGTVTLAPIRGVGHLRLVA